MTHRNFNEDRAAYPRMTFELGPHTFTCRAEVRPEAILAYEALDEATNVGDAMSALDDAVCSCLIDADAKTWRKLRAEKGDEQLGLATVQSVVVWLIEQVVARPTALPSASSGGSTTVTSGTTLTGESHSLAAVASAG